MAQQKKKFNNFAQLLIKDRFGAQTKSQKHLDRVSTTEYTGVSMLAEKLTVENKQIYNAKEHQYNDDIEQKYTDLIESMDYDLHIPPRTPYEAVEKGDFKRVESIVFNRWKYLNRDKIFERNIEIWRQFWITCERSTIIAQIIDSRNPVHYFNEDILKMYPKKQHWLFFNKSDLISNPDEGIKKISEFRGGLHGISGYYTYSSKVDRFDYPINGTIGLIGYPNVGKSSTINLILKEKRVKVSSTPGKTKYIQTIDTPDFTLLDCPGLVFPSHNKITLVLMGILNIDQIPDLAKYQDVIISYVGEAILRKHYGVPDSQKNFINDMSTHKGWEKSKCLKILTKDFVNGLINKK